MLSGPALLASARTTEGADPKPPGQPGQLIERSRWVPWGLPYPIYYHPITCYRPAPLSRISASFSRLLVGSGSRLDRFTRSPSAHPSIRFASLSCLEFALLKTNLTINPFQHWRLRRSGKHTRCAADPQILTISSSRSQSDRKATSGRILLSFALGLHECVLSSSPRSPGLAWAEQPTQTGKYMSWHVDHGQIKCCLVRA